MSLSPKQKAEVLRDELQPTGTPHNMRRGWPGATDFQTPGADAAPEPQYHHTDHGAWQTPSSHTAEPALQPGAAPSHQAHASTPELGNPVVVTEALASEFPKSPSIPLQENLGRGWYRDKGNSAGMRKEFYLALINQKFLTMPNLSGKLLTISNALKGSTWQVFSPIQKLFSFLAIQQFFSLSHFHQTLNRKSLSLSSPCTRIHLFLGLQNRICFL